MNATETTILWLVVWWAVLILQLPVIRLMASKKTGSMMFDPDGKDLQGYSARLTRAVGNCQENIPLYIGVLLFALYSSNSAVTEPTACWLLYARIGQSVTHLISVSNTAIFVRFGFFAVQTGLIVCWVVQMLLG